MAKLDTDKILSNLKIDKVTDSMKDDLTNWLLITLLPVAKPAAEDFVNQLKEQAKSEIGWFKFRDLVVLPFIIQGGLWIIEQALTKTVENTK